MIRKTVKRLKCDRGAVDMTALVLMSWLVIMLMVAGVDIFLMANRFIVLNNTAQKALEMMKEEGRLTNEIEDIFFAELEQQNITRDSARIVDASTETVLRGEPIHLHVQARYELKSFKPLGMSSEQLTMNWGVRKTGISRRFIRPTFGGGP
ncbi:MAG: DUF4320 family protein [Dethiobacter sp.]|nr:DUF4320 family protein [Dethiobacter sp.]